PVVVPSRRLGTMPDGTVQIAGESIRECSVRCPTLIARRGLLDCRSNERVAELEAVGSKRTETSADHRRPGVNADRDASNRIRCLKQQSCLAVFERRDEEEGSLSRVQFTQSRGERL